MTDYDPYAGPTRSSVVKRRACPAAPRRTLVVWIRCWTGIGAAGVILGFFAGGAWGLMFLSPRVALAGLAGSVVSFGVVGLFHGRRLSPKWAMRASLLSGVLTGAVLCYSAPVILAVLLTAVLVTGATLPEHIFQDRVAHRRVLKMVDRSRGVTARLRLPGHRSRRRRRSGRRRRSRQGQSRRGPQRSDSRPPASRSPESEPATSVVTAPRDS
ncbi:MAG: hypothetical protein NXI04_15125 [Planctomycetaceae bacterium]|nr:hypothetical protein [Planctomycetaceae bacterium]